MSSTISNVTYQDCIAPDGPEAILGIRNVVFTAVKTRFERENARFMVVSAQ